MGVRAIAERAIPVPDDGRRLASTARTLSVDAACEYFFRLVMSLRHDRLVGFFRAEANAAGLRARLGGHGIASTMDRVPYCGMHDPRFRVFVLSKAIFAAREALGELLLSDEVE
jgi:hypothetical protein